MMPVNLTWTRFADKSATVKQEVAQDFADLVQHIATAGPYPTKTACPWLKLARFGERRSVKGSLRNDGNLVEITGVEGDYDAGLIAPEQAINMLERAGLKAVVYTSPSHTDVAPRWRVLAPTSAPLAPSERTHMLARINGALGGILTDESFTLSQGYFYGRVVGQSSYRVLVTFDDLDDGDFVDQAHSLDSIAVAKTPRPRAEGALVGAGAIAAKVEQLGRRLRTGDGRRELLKSYIGDKSNRGLSADEVRVLVDDTVSRFFDSEDPIDWSNINGLISDICSSDQAERETVQATVGAFVEKVARGEITAPATAKTEGALRLRRAVVDFRFLKPVKWLLNGFVASGEVMVWAGQPGVGKSTVLGAMSMVVAGFGSDIGSDLENDRPRRVVIVSEHAAQYEKIFFGFVKRFDLNADAVMDQVILFDAARLARTEIAREVLALIELATADEPPLVVLDTASASFDLPDENSNAEVGAVLAELKRPIMQTGAPLWVIAHAAKALGREDSEITPRGASAYIGDVHGTGSVFRDKLVPDSTFLKSLKNRTEREFSEIEVKTQVDWYEVADDRGVIQRIGVRTGVPMKATEKRAQAAQDAAEGAQHASALIKSNKAKGSALQGSLIALLVSAPMKTLKAADLVNALVAQGFKQSPTYRAIDQLTAQGVLTKSMGRVHLNGNGTHQGASED